MGANEIYSSLDSFDRGCLADERVEEKPKPINAFEELGGGSQTKQ